jgi:glycosyltransferase involved in cell wall biosynthesis
VKIVAIVPGYNEETRIEATIHDAAPFVDAIVVIDDCSRDATSARARAAGAYVLRHVINRGQGAALQTGMDFAIQKLGADIVVHFDADGQMQGSEIPMMVEPIVRGEVDVTLGSRFLGTAVNIPLARKMMLKAAIVFTFITSGLWLTDTHNGFRALSKKAVQAIRLRQDRMAHASEILDLIAEQKLRYRELPVTIRYTEETLAKGQKMRALFRVAFDLMKGKTLR